MASLIPLIKARFDDLGGLPLAGGKIYTYVAGTTTPTATYSDPMGLVPNENPVILDASGQADIWLRPGSYKVVVADADDVILYMTDHVKPADGGGGGIVDSDYTFDAWSLRFNEQFTSTGLMDTLTKIIKPGYQSPAISLSASGSGTIREKGTVVSSTTLTATITKKSNPIAQVRFYLSPSTLLDTQSSGGAIPGGGSSTYSYTTPFSDNITFRAEVDDTSGPEGGPSTVSATVSFPFVYPYYYGVGAAGLGAGVSGLTKDVITSNANLTRNFSPSGSQKMYLAYPASYGPLTSIFDVNNFDTIPDWTRTTVNITGLDGNPVSYYVYEFNNYAVAGTYPYRFVR